VHATAVKDLMLRHVFERAADARLEQAG